MNSFIKKHLLLPTPRDLGWSSSEHYDALPMKDFAQDGETNTWEAFEALLKKQYPIRSFLRYTIKEGINIKVWWPAKRLIENAWYWLKCHLLPSYRFHFLDLRQPKLLNGKENCDYYTHGWRDADHQMVLALFSILENFVKHELPNYYCPSEEEAELVGQRDCYLEVLAIHHYWTVERQELQQRYESLLHDWSQARKVKDTHNVGGIWEQMIVAERAIHDREDDMLMRLLEVRKGMWT